MAEKPKFGRSSGAPVPRPRKAQSDSPPGFAESPSEWDAGLPERLLLLTDNRFEHHGEVSHHNATDLVNGREGDVLFVNGEVMPRSA